MFDLIYVKYSIKKEPPPILSYSPEQAIVGKRLLNPKSDKLCVVMPGWHNSAKSFPVNRLANRLAKKGWAVLVYDFHQQILEADDKEVAASFKHLRQTINEDLCSLIARRKYKRVHLLGISLGNIVCTLVADTFTSFTEATLVVGGDDLAIDMWHGLRTQNFRREFEKLHIGIRDLDREWEGIAPVNHLKHFKNKPVRVVIATADKFILTKYQKKLAQRLKDNGALVKIKKNHLGHVLTIVRFCMFGSI